MRTGAFRFLPCIPACPAFLKQNDDEDGEAPREPVCWQLMGGGLGWHRETEILQIE